MGTLRKYFFNKGTIFNLAKALYNYRDTKNLNKYEYKYKFLINKG